MIVYGFGYICVMIMDIVIRGKGHPLQIRWQFVVRVFIVKF